MSDPLSITASVITVLHLASTATTYLKNIKHGSSDRIKLRDEVRNTTCLLEMLKDRIEDAEDAGANLEAIEYTSMKSLSGPDGPLTLFRRVLEDIIVKLSPQDTLRQRALPCIWPFAKKDVAEMLACLERLKSNFSLVMQSDLVQLARLSNRKMDDIGRKLDDSNANDQDDQAQKIIDWVSPLSFRQKHLAILESVQQGTGGWLIQHETFQRWQCWAPLVPRHTSIIVNYLEHERHSKDCPCVFVYCDYNHRKEQAPVALLSSLLQQVLQHSASKTLPPDVFSLYDSHKKYGTRPTLTQVTGLLSSLSSAFKALYVIVDALDECAESEESSLHFMSTVLSIGPQVKVLCTSRFSTTFTAYFAHAEKLEIFAQDEDIRMFLASEINRQSMLSRHVQADPNLKADIVDTITEECKGMFLLAKLHLDSLSTKINRKQVRSSLHTLPETLDATYSEAIQRIYDQPPDIVDLAETVLFWIICACRPLTVLHLQHMYATWKLDDGMPLEDDDLPDGDVLTGACGSLITIDKESQTTNPIHYTVQQYFEGSLSAKLMAARLSLSKTCLAYLSLPNFSTGFCATDAAMSQRLAQTPFLDYAAKYWGSSVHLFDPNDTLPALLRFVSNPVTVEVTSQVWSLSSVRYANWSQGFPRDVPAMVLAAAFDLPFLLRKMVAGDHDIEGKGSDKETALIRAAAFGRTDNVRVLLELGAEVNSGDYMGETALQRAARNGHAGVAQVLLDGGADVNAKASGNWTSLMSAVSSENIGLVRMLVQAGADLMAETIWGDSALSMAARSGQEVIATFLADHGAILPRGATGRRASIVASRRGLRKLVRRLTIDYKAIAGKALQRQSSKLMSGLPGIHEAAEGSINDSARRSGSQTLAQESDEDSFAELMERYGLKVGFFQRYTLEKFIANGSFAEVFACSNKVTSVVFAVKVISEKSFPQYHIEIELFRELEKHYHPNILMMADLFAEYEQNQMYLVLDYASGGDLFHHIVSRGKLTQTETRTVFSQLFSAVEFLHNLGWVHRDVKPENILIANEEPVHIRLGDLGMAKKLSQSASAEPSGFTSSLCGTPSYVAPEIIQETDKRRYGYAVDVWSCGVVLYICLCGFPPFSDELETEKNPFTLAQQIKLGRFDYPSPYWDLIPDTAIDLIDRMLTVDVGKRITVKECISHSWMLSPHSSVPQDTEEQTNIYERSC